jgi:hypothetical protein
MLKLQDSEPKFLMYKYNPHTSYYDYYWQDIAYMRIWGKIVYIITKDVVDKLGGFNIISAENYPQRLPLRSKTLDLYDNRLLDKHLPDLAIQRQAKRIIIDNINSPYLLDAGILTVPYSDNGLYYSVIQKLEKMLPPYEVRYYTINKKAGIDRVVDTTDRTLIDRVFNGYIGNRLDIMVTDYDICVFTQGRGCILALKSGNSLQFYNDNLLEIFENILNKPLLAIYIVKE